MAILVPAAVVAMVAVHILSGSTSRRNDSLAPFSTAQAGSSRPASLCRLLTPTDVADAMGVEARAERQSPSAPFPSCNYVLAPPDGGSVSLRRFDDGSDMAKQCRAIYGSPVRPQAMSALVDGLTPHGAKACYGEVPGSSTGGIPSLIVQEHLLTLGVGLPYGGDEHTSTGGPKDLPWRMNAAIVMMNRTLRRACGANASLCGA